MPTLPLIAHWPLTGSADDMCAGQHGVASKVLWTEGPGGNPNGAALFNGRDSQIEIADAPDLQLGGDEFSASAWVKCDTPMRGAYGDVLSKFDSERRCGLNLWVSGGSAGYSSFGDARHVHV